MKHKNNILMIIIALVLVFALAACGQKTNEAVNNDNLEKSEESMETTAPHDDDSTDDESNEDSTEEGEEDDSIGHEDNDDNSMTDEDSDFLEEENDNNPMTDEDSEGTMDDEETNELKVFTLEELSAYNGLDGKPAYVAVDGVVYDFTNLGAWRNGKHNGFTAGKDLTDEIINASPHGVKNLEGVPIVGSIAE